MRRVVDTVRASKGYHPAVNSFVWGIVFAGLLGVPVRASLPEMDTVFEMARPVAPRDIPRRIIREPGVDNPSFETEFGTGFTKAKWMRYATIGGLSLAQYRPTDFQINRGLEDLSFEGVTVAHVTSRLMDYLNDEEFARELDLVRRVARSAKKIKVRVFWNVPLLEQVTPEGRIRRDSIGRLHPDWLAISFDQHTRALTYPARPRDSRHRDEQAGMCPNGPYRDFLLERIRQLARTGIDGLWFSSAGLESPEVFWTCADARCRARFERETKMEFPSSIDLSDARFRRFVRWRHEMLARFVSDCARTARTINPEIGATVEVGSLETGMATRCGIDGAYLKDVPVVWKIESVSRSTGMADATVDDWISHMTTYRWCRGVSWSAPTWAYCPGLWPEDAELVLGECLAAQVNPYEIRNNQSATSVSSHLRTNVFSLIDRHAKDLFDARSAATVGLLFSSRSRDFLDGLRPGGQFVSWGKPTRDIAWANSENRESTASAPYLGEFRGWAKLLIQGGVPFDVVPSEGLSVDRLIPYRCLVVPALAALSERDRELLLSWAARGGTLIVTGAASGLYDDTGKERRRSLWDGLRAGGQTVGQGRILGVLEPFGSRSFGKGDKSVHGTALDWLSEAGVSPVVADGKPVYVHCYRNESRTIVHAIHYGWVGSRDRSPTPVSATFRVPLPNGAKACRVIVQHPGKAAVEIPGVVENGRVRFAADILVYGLIMIETR